MNYVRIYIYLCLNPYIRSYPILKRVSAFSPRIACATLTPRGRASRGTSSVFIMHEITSAARPFPYPAGPELIIALGPDEISSENGDIDGFEGTDAHPMNGIGETVSLSVLAVKNNLGP
jgi:hypothetical protein